MSDLAKVFDVFFNGRPADPPVAKPKVTIEQLVERGTSRVLLDGKLYKVVVTEEK